MYFIIFTKLILQSKVCDKFGKTTLIEIGDVFVLEQYIYLVQVVD